MSTQDSKVIVIGLDGASWNIIDLMREEGKLPNLGKIIEEGSSGYLKAPIDSNSFGSWTEFATGVGPDKHGIFCSQKKVNGSYKSSIVNFKDIGVKTFWKIISEQGGKVGIINVPMTYPPEEINGFLISGIIVPNSHAIFTYPSDLSSKLLESGYSVEEVLFASKNYESYQQLLNAVKQSEKKRLETSLSLLSEYDPDLFVVVFVGLDRIQHYFWHFFDRSHPLYASSAEIELKEAIPKSYELLDECVGKILESATSQDYRIMIISDHGFEPYCRIFSLNRWLANEGYLKWNPSLGPRLREISASLIVKLRLKKYLKEVLLRKFPKKARGFKQDLRVKLIDWRKTVAYSGDSGHISMNLRGREPEGIVEPGSEYRKLTNTIKNQLLNFTDPISGQRIFGEVLLRDEVFTGKHKDNIPDIIVSSQIKGLIPHARLDHRYGLITSVKEFNKDQDLVLSGAHNSAYSRDGVFICTGRGLRNQEERLRLEMKDIAPTILFLMDMPIPENMEGKTARSIFQEQFLRQRNPRYGNSSELEQVSKNGFLSKDDEAEILERLKGLGYID